MSFKQFAQILLFFLIATGSSMAQSESIIKVSGKVMDEATKAPISAKLTYEKLPYGDDMGLYHSENDGIYTFFLVQGHTYTIDVRADGYLPYSEQIDMSNVENGFAKDFLLTSNGEGKLIRMHNLVFEQGKADILPSSYPELNKIVAMMNDNENMKIQLEGHTDFRGRATLNMDLSKKRVESVKKYIVAQGISKKRVSTKAFGGTQPITREDSEDARRLNRRVEVRILER